jgi:cell division protein FtsL
MQATLVITPRLLNLGKLSMFILISLLVNISTYLFISMLLYAQNVSSSIIWYAKLSKLILSVAITYEIKQIINCDLYNNNKLLRLFIFILLNIICVVLSQYYSVYRAHAVYSIINITVITLVAFIVEMMISPVNYMSYYIDNKIINLLYFIASIIDFNILKIICMFFLSLKIISIYNSTYFIISNKLRNNYFYLLMIYFSLFTRYLDISLNGNILT